MTFSHTILKIFLTSLFPQYLRQFNTNKSNPGKIAYSKYTITINMRCLNTIRMILRSLHCKKRLHGLEVILKGINTEIIRSTAYQRVQMLLT